MKCAMGIILGELARLQRHLGIATYPDHEIYGLVHGLESVIDARIKKHWVSAQQALQAREMLQYYADHTELPLNGFEDLQDKLITMGIDRSKATIIFTLFKSVGAVPEVFAKLEDGGMCLEIDLENR